MCFLRIVSAALILVISVTDFFFFFLQEKKPVEHKFSYLLGLIDPVQGFCVMLCCMMQLFKGMRSDTESLTGMNLKWYVKWNICLWYFINLPSQFTSEFVSEYGWCTFGILSLSLSLFLFLSLSLSVCLSPSLSPTLSLSLSLSPPPSPPPPPSLSLSA